MKYSQAVKKLKSKNKSSGTRSSMTMTHRLQGKGITMTRNVGGSYRGAGTRKTPVLGGLDVQPTAGRDVEHFEAHGTENPQKANRGKEGQKKLSVKARSFYSPKLSVKNSPGVKYKIISNKR